MRNPELSILSILFLVLHELNAEKGSKDENSNTSDQDLGSFLSAPASATDFLCNPMQILLLLCISLSSVIKVILHLGAVRITS